MKHKFELVWLTDDLEGFRCKNCGYESVVPEDEFNSCPQYLDFSFGYFELAKNVSKYSQHRYRVGCVLINHKPLSVGFNKTKTHTKYANPETSNRKAIHAEVSAILNAGKESVRNGTAYIYRETRDGVPALARPCEDCMERLREFGIKRIFYTTDEYPYYKEERI